MVNFQECLNKKYPSKGDKEKVEFIEVNYYYNHCHEEIDGEELDLREYPNLKKVIIVGSYLKSPLTKLDISGCPSLRELWCHNNASIIPLERLFVIRGNIKQFLNKWGKRPENTWLNCWKQSSLNKLDELKSPQQYNYHWRLSNGIQWANRATSIVGGTLLLIGAGDSNNEYAQTGGYYCHHCSFYRNSYFST